MISEKDKATIANISAQYKVGRVLVFGTSAEQAREGQDIDLAVEGIRPEDFFRFYGDLLFSLSRPVDLIDLSSKSKFTEIVRREGIPLYG